MENLVDAFSFSVFAGSFLLFILCAFIVAFIQLYRKRRAQHKAEKHELEIQFSQTLMQSQLEIQEQTFQHIAHELHDNLGQIASLIKINLNTIQLSDSKSYANETIDETKNLLKQLITDLKLLSVNLSGQRIAHLGIINGLEAEVVRLNKTGLYKADLRIEGDIPSIDEQKVIILYRMIQEIINNFIKHGHGKHISIAIRGIQNKLVNLEIIDDGVGFDVEKAMNKGGSGLINLNNRANLLNADLTITSEPTKGTRIIIDLPLS